jgi:prepilin-type N-terminal cleavage/methylation domain-containing protein
MRQRAFTIVELLIVITVIAILAAITVVGYNGIQDRARNAQRISDLKNTESLLEAYFARNGSYPATTNQPKSNWKAIDVRTDENCPNGSSQADWIPDISQLPQSNQTGAKGVGGTYGCYLYASNGEQYVLSAWNMLSSPQTEDLYRRLGFREFQSDNSTQFYTCNSNTVGGANGGYNASNDYYKHSYTISNISDCDETPPAGA